MSVKTSLAPSGKLAPSVSYNGIDLMKFICAIFVFMLHSRPFPESAPYMNYYTIVLCRLAVPFFFVSSGFFLFRKMDLYSIDTDIVRKYCTRILFLYGLWKVVIVFGETNALWYLSATAVAVVFLSVCIKVFKLKISTLIAIVSLLYIIGMLGNSYSFAGAHLANVPILGSVFKLYKSVFVLTRNGVFFGSAFVLMGALFAQYKIRLSAKKAWIGFVISLVFMYTEAFILKEYTPMVDFEMSVMLVPTVFFFFAFAMSLNLKDKPVYRKLRTISMLIYFIHWPLKNIVEIALDNIKSRLGINLFPYLFIISLFVVLSVTFALEWLSRKEKFKWINWFI